MPTPQPPAAAVAEPNPAAIASTPESRTLAWARTLAFVLVLIWIVGAPFYRQILHGKNKHARPWMMFSTIGLGVVDARFYAQQPDGTRRAVDRFEALGARRPAHVAQRRLRGQHATWALARQLCRRLGPAADVRAVARRATSDGWVLDHDGEENLCVAPRPRERSNPRGRR